MSKKLNGTQKYNFLIRLDQLAALRGIEQKIGIPIAVQLRRAIDAYLKQQKKATS